MATPKTGAIKFSELNTEIMQASSTATLNMNTAAQRMGYPFSGPSAEVSMSNLRGCFGGTITFGTIPGTTFYPPTDGYIINQIGTIDDALYNSPDRIIGLYEVQGLGASRLEIDNGSAGDPSAGWQGTDITRIAINNSTRTISGYLQGTTFKEFETSIGSASCGFGIKWG